MTHIPVYTYIFFFGFFPATKSYTYTWHMFEKLFLERLELKKENGPELFCVFLICFTSYSCVKLSHQKEVLFQLSPQEFLCWS